MIFKKNPLKPSQAFIGFAVLIALTSSSAQSSAPAAAPPTTRSLQIIDLGQAVAVKTTIKDQATGEWQAEFEFDLKVTANAMPSFTVSDPVAVQVSSTAQAIGSTGFTHVKVHLTSKSKLPITVTLIGQFMERPMRITVPAPLIVIPDPTVDRIVLGSLLLAAIIVMAGAVAARKSVWTDIGTQTWSFDSWATNTAVGAGVVALVMKIIPGADVPYTQLSAILGFIGAIAPTAYNLTTRTLAAALKGKVLFFVVSAILTGGSVLGQLQIAFKALHSAVGKIPPNSLAGLEAILFLVGAAFVFHLFTGTRDTIVAQAPSAPGAPAAAVPARHRLEGGGFTAL